METTGELAVLNVGAGDIRVTFNREDRGETAKAIRMLKDMQARGYAIMVALPDGTYARAKRVDERTGSYVLVLPDDVEAPAEATVSRKGRGAKKGRKTVKVPVKRSRAVGVARSAGG